MKKKMVIFEVYFRDLSRRAQKRFLTTTGYKTASEGGWDSEPIATLTA
jgi:hypothetical protein